MKTILLLICSIILFLSSCKEDKQVVQFDLTPQLKKTIQLMGTSPKPINLNLCDFVKFSWDSVYVIEPYASEIQLRNAGFDNSAIFEKKMPELTLDESKSILLFINRKHIEQYCIVDRSLVDFSTIMKRGRRVLSMSKSDACNNAVFERGTDGIVILKIP
ncbi:hypothetical protein [Pedobacter sp. Leaf170]|uniref:hypothetical protein n=1 Tax=Pedobacter sp. Leaf170 TaxID=2876558 RepID=UPI001E35D414|nr:hypothetical protein [Pedobacter sp. Leaf170]